MTFNDPALTERMVPTLRRVSGDRGVVAPAIAEDFFKVSGESAGMFFYLGVNQKGADPLKWRRSRRRLLRRRGRAADRNLAMVNLAVDYLQKK